MADDKGQAQPVHTERQSLETRRGLKLKWIKAKAKGQALPAHNLRLIMIIARTAIDVRVMQEDMWKREVCEARCD